MEEHNLPYVLMDGAKAPTKSHFEDGGWDFYALERVVVPAAKLDISEVLSYLKVSGNKVGYQHTTFYEVADAIQRLQFSPAPLTRVRTGVRCKLSSGTVGILFDRSGMSFNNNITRVGGVIDSTFVGEIVAGLVNFGKRDHIIEPGDKVIQMVILNTPLHVGWKQVEELIKTERGEKGFGSTS